nr:hypothetical protein [uncultured Sediminibacterium sp.]
MTLLDRYRNLMRLIQPDKWKYFHYRSLNNFILQLDNEMLSNDRDYLNQKLIDFFDVIGENVSELDGQVGIEIFEKYINPIGKKLKKYGFKSITPIKYLFLYSVMIDSLFFLAFYPFPYPISTAIVLLYYTIRMKWIYNSNKVYGTFY